MVMTAKLFIKALAMFLLGVALVGLLIFLPAGTLSFFNGWLFMGVLFVPMLLVGCVLMLKNPALLQKRLSVKEKQRQQKVIVISSALMFCAGFAVSGFGFRFGMYMINRSISVSGAVLFLVGYIMYAEVLRENSFLSRTIEIGETQKVIDTGLYGIIRHPMYSATLLMFLSIPVILGSLYSLVIFLAYPFIIVCRIKAEEEFLEKELFGYCDYKKKVRYRLIPFVW